MKVLATPSVKPLVCEVALCPGKFSFEVPTQLHITDAQDVFVGFILF